MHTEYDDVYDEGMAVICPWPSDFLNQGEPEHGPVYLSLECEGQPASPPMEVWLFTKLEVSHCWLLVVAS